MLPKEAQSAPTIENAAPTSTRSEKLTSCTSGQKITAVPITPRSAPRSVRRLTRVPRMIRALTMLNQRMAVKAIALSAEAM